MCGRIVQTAAPHVLAEEFFLDAVPDLAASWNLPPGRDIATVVPHPDTAGNLVRLMLWGLTPPWLKGRDAGTQLINARSETALEKPAFREAFLQRRCLVPVDGFYEWQKRDGGSQPFLFRRHDGRPFALAGLWEPREQPGGRAFASCTILTTAANSVMRPIHHRMPAILPAESWRAWLTAPAAEAPGLAGLLQPAPADLLHHHPVSRRVGGVEFDEPACLEPVWDDRGGQMNLFG